MILITGGLGFIGLHTARAFLEAGEDVVLTRHHTYREPGFLSPYLGSRAFIETVDASNRAELAAAGRKYQVTGIVHLAGAPLMGTSTVDGLRLNMTQLLNVLEVGSELGVRRVSLASSGTVYIGVQAETLREDAPLPVASPYPIVAHKKILEIAGDHYAAQTGLSVIALRIPLVYGPLYHSMNSLASRMVHAAVRGVPGPLPAPGWQAQPPAFEEDENWNLCYAPDCAEAIARLQLADALPHAIYNIGGPRNVTNREVADAVCRVVPGATLELQPGHSRTPPVPPLDLTRIREDVGWAPRIPVEEGIADYVAWLRAGNGE